MDLCRVPQIRRVCWPTIRQYPGRSQIGIQAEQESVKKRQALKINLRACGTEIKGQFWIFIRVKFWFSNLSMLRHKISVSIVWVRHSVVVALYVLTDAHTGTIPAVSVQLLSRFGKFCFENGGIEIPCRGWSFPET